MHQNQCFIILITRLRLNVETNIHSDPLKDECAINHEIQGEFEIGIKTCLLMVSPGHGSSRPPMLRYYCIVTCVVMSAASCVLSCLLRPVCPHPSLQCPELSLDFKHSQSQFVIA